MVVGRPENPDSCDEASYGLGPWRLFVLLVHDTKNELNWLGTWTTEIHTILLASVLEQVDAAEFQGNSIFILTLQRDAWISVLPITTPALPDCLSRLLWFSP